MNISWGNCEETCLDKFQICIKISHDFHFIYLFCIKISIKHSVHTFWFVDIPDVTTNGMLFWFFCFLIEDQLSRSSQFTHDILSFQFDSCWKRKVLLFKHSSQPDFFSRQSVPDNFLLMLEQKKCRTVFQKLFIVCIKQELHFATKNIRKKLVQKVKIYSRQFSSFLIYLSLFSAILYIVDYIEYCMWRICAVVGGCKKLLYLEKFKLIHIRNWFFYLWVNCEFDFYIKNLFQFVLTNFQFFILKKSLDSRQPHGLDECH